jgi:hypothetical protein
VGVPGQVAAERDAEGGRTLAALPQHAQVGELRRQVLEQQDAIAKSNVEQQRLQQQLQQQLAQVLAQLQLQQQQQQPQQQQQQQQQQQPQQQQQQQQQQ